MADEVICKVRCFDGYWNTLVYPRPIKKGEVVEVSEAVAKRMQQTNTGVQIEERKLKVNKAVVKNSRRKKDDSQT